MSNGSQLDLLNWIGISSASSQHLSGDPVSPYVAFIIDTQAGYPASFPAGTFFYIKNVQGNPWDICQYDQAYALRHWITEDGDTEDQSLCPNSDCWNYPNAYKRFLNPLPILPRYLTPGTPSTIQTPGPNTVFRTVNCEQAVTGVITLGDVQTVTSGPTNIDWGGSIGNAPTIQNDYLYSGSIGAQDWRNKETTYYVQGFGRVGWYNFVRPSGNGSWGSYTNSNVNTVLATGGSPVPIFPCGAGKSWWVAGGGGGAITPTPPPVPPLGTTIFGAIHQGAFQDAWDVPILRPNTDYSIRIDIRCPSGITDGGGYLVIDCVSSSAGKLYGSSAFPLSAMTKRFQTLVLPFLPKDALPIDVPKDLQLRLYAADLPSGSDVEIDRFEVFPTRTADLVTDIYGSYIQNLEAVDGVSGDMGISVQNNQPVLGAFVNYDILYFLKTGSLFSTQDSPAEEPAAWRIRQISNKVGTCGIHAYDYGEEWMLTANRLGVYAFSGREPIKISQEIQNIWDAINWTYGYTIILRNDVAQRRFTIHVPLCTPCPWLPDASLNANPTTPNVMLACSYKELQTAAALEERGPVKLAYSGRLIAWDMSRKWSIWQIPSPYSDLVKRPDTTEQYFIGNGRHNSKVYELNSDVLNDDGIPIHSLYTTYGLVRSDQAQQFGQQLGMYRKLYKYSSYNISGAGELKLRALLNDLNTPHPYTVPGGIKLACPGDENREVPFNLQGQRMYLEFSTHGVKDNFRLSEIIMSVVKAPFAPVRGLN